MTVYIEDDFFDERQLDFILKEVRDRTNELRPCFFGETMIHRILLDETYSDSSKSPCLTFFGQKFNVDLVDKIKDIEEYPYYKMRHPFGFNTFISQFREEDRRYKWHTDGEADAPRTFMSFVYYVNSDFKGGVLTYREGGKEIEVLPVENRFVLIPANVKHSITQVYYDKQHNFRTTVNGFLYVR